MNDIILETYCNSFKFENDKQDMMSLFDRAVFYDSIIGRYNFLKELYTEELPYEYEKQVSDVMSKFYFFIEEYYNRISKDKENKNYIEAFGNKLLEDTNSFYKAVYEKNTEIPYGVFYSIYSQILDLNHDMRKHLFDKYVLSNNFSYYVKEEICKLYSNMKKWMPLIDLVTDENIKFNNKKILAIIYDILYGLVAIYLWSITIHPEKYDID